MKRYHKIATLFIGFSIFLSQYAIANAQILPRTDKNTKECFEFLHGSNTAIETKLKSPDTKQTDRDTILGCTIKTGEIELWMLPFFVTYLINFLLAIAGLICTLFIVVGGYWYIVGSAMGQTEKGKNTILYAIIGLIVTLMAWIIVNIVQAAVS